MRSPLWGLLLRFLPRLIGVRERFGRMYWKICSCRFFQSLGAQKRARRPDKVTFVWPYDPHAGLRTPFDLQVQALEVDEPSLTYKVTDSNGCEMRVYRNGPGFAVGLDGEGLHMGHSGPS